MNITYSNQPEQIMINQVGAKININLNTKNVYEAYPNSHREFRTSGMDNPCKSITDTAKGSQGRLKIVPGNDRNFDSEIHSKKSGGKHQVICTIY